MFGSTVLEVAIGLTFCYGTVALIVTTLQEALASVFRLRAHTLLDGIRSMLNDPGFTGLAQAVYAHPLVNPHVDGSAADPRDLKAKPSYIEPANFAIALVDSISRVPGEFSSLGPQIDAIPDPQLRLVLQGLYRRAANLQQFQHAIAAWFDNAMDRTSGAYKRRQQLISLALSLLVAILFNIDSIHLFQALWLHPAAASQVSGAPGVLDPEVIKTLQSLPIGWESFPPVLGAAFAVQVAGWLITASTTLFGAPFWFDLLQRAVQMRGTGAKPDERRQAVRIEGQLTGNFDAVKPPVVAAA